MAERGRHAVVLEAARRVHALILQIEPARRDADVFGHALGRLEQRLAFADGDASLDRRERQQVVEPPHAAETVRIVALGPFPLEIGQLSRRREPVPIVGDIQETSATVAGDADFIDGKGRAAGRRDALLVGGGRCGNGRVLDRRSFKESTKKGYPPI